MPKRNGWRNEEINWDDRAVREQDEDWASEEENSRDEYGNMGRAETGPTNTYNRPGGGRGYGRGDYGQGQRNRLDVGDQGEWAGRGYGRGDYGQGRRNRPYPSEESMGRGYSRGDYAQGQRNRSDWANRSTEWRGRGYGYGDYGQDYGRRSEDWNDMSDRSMNQGRMDYGRGQEDYEMDEPVTWTYAEWWLMPGPYTGRGPEGWQRPNERIMEDVCERLTQYGHLDASKVKVDVDNGEVTLTGTVNNRRDKRRAEDVVESVPGVRDVHNQLRVQEERRPSSQMP